MGDVAHELPAGVVDGLQPVGHVVKVHGKVGQFGAAVHRARAVKSPLPSLRAASLMASMGPVKRRANTAEITLATISAMAAESRNMLAMSPT